MEELPRVLWAHRTMIKSRNGDTPFSLTYETEAIIPTEIGMPILRDEQKNQRTGSEPRTAPEPRRTELELELPVPVPVLEFEIFWFLGRFGSVPPVLDSRTEYPIILNYPTLKQNNEALEINLDLLEERREQATIREAKSKAKMEKYYNSKVRSMSFKPGDLVYRNNEASRAEDTVKLGPKWEGPYEVTEALGKGTYKLRDRDGNQLSRTWNISNLKKCTSTK
ncbi:hypothetical protein Tco_1384705 [Tanacetum coccineum]